MRLTLLSKPAFTWIVHCSCVITRILKWIKNPFDRRSPEAPSLGAVENDKTLAPSVKPAALFLQNLVALENQFAKQKINVEYHVVGIFPDQSQRINSGNFIAQSYDMLTEALALGGKPWQRKLVNRNLVQVKSNLPSKFFQKSWNKLKNDVGKMPMRWVDLHLLNMGWWA